MGPLVVELFEKIIEFALLLQAVPARGARGLRFEREVHAFMPAILLRMPMLDAFDGDAQAQPPDVFLHYPYTDGARSDLDPSLHFVWFDEILTDSVGGGGVYMQFHSDNSNPWNGGFWQHWRCDV